MNASHGFRCSFCDGAHMTEIMDFGEVALAGGFLRPEERGEEKKYPLRLYFCSDCYALQVVDKVSADTLFRDYFYFSSAIGTLREHFSRYARDVTSRFLGVPSDAVAVEFGCNDGVLLRPLADQGVGVVVGVDPATNIVRVIDDPRVSVVNDFFTEAVAEQIVESHGPADVVMANNVYAHIPDIQGTTRAIRSVLADDGVFIFEAHYLGKLLEGIQYDMIYHEHLYYYSLVSAIRHFKRYDMVVFDAEPVATHAGSVRYYVSKKTGEHGREPTPRLIALREEELAKRFDRVETFTDFEETARRRRSELMELVEELRASGFRIAGYGASGRANTMIQYCGLDRSHLEYMIDDAPAKAGYLTPGSHLPIYSSAVLDDPVRRPDYVLLFAWSFLEEILERNRERFAGIQLIVPLPEVRVISPGGGTRPERTRTDESR